MACSIVNVTFSACDTHGVAAFWRDALGYEAVQASDDLVRLAPHGGGSPDLLFICARRDGAPDF